MGRWRDESDHVVRRSKNRFDQWRRNKFSTGSRAQSFLRTISFSFDVALSLRNLLMKKKKKYLRHKASNNSLKRLVRISKSGSLSTCPFLPAISFILFLYSFFSHRLPSIPTTTMLTSSFWIEVRTNVKQINIKTKLVTKIWGEEEGDWKAHDIGSISLSSTEAVIFKTLNPGSNSDFS